MIGSLCEVVMLPENGLRQIIDEVNFKYYLQEGDPEWFDPDEFVYLFWCDQEFGTDCYMKLDVSRAAIERNKNWLLQYENNGADEYSVYVTKAQIRVLEYIRARIPAEVDTVLMPLSY